MTKTDSDMKYVIKQEKTIAQRVEENRFNIELTEMSVSLAAANSLLRCQRDILYNNYVIIIKWGIDWEQDIQWLDVDHELNKLYTIIYKSKKCI